MIFSEKSSASSPEEINPYGSSLNSSESSQAQKQSVPGEKTSSTLVIQDVKKIRTVHLQDIKDAGQHFSMLTAYDQQFAQLFDQAGIEVLLTGDSASTNVLGQSSTLEITLDQMIPLVKAVSQSSQRALVIADLPFGSYEVSPEQAVKSSIRYMKEGLAHAVKLEVNTNTIEQIEAIVNAGIPVMAHLGFTPQSEHALGGFRIQGKTQEEGQKLVELAKAAETAGAFSVLVEMIPTIVAQEIDQAISIPTVGIGAGNSTTGQVLVWQDMLGLTQGKLPRFVRKYADLNAIVTDAVTHYAEDVRSGSFPSEKESFIQTPSH